MEKIEHDNKKEQFKKKASGDLKKVIHLFEKYNIDKQKFPYNIYDKYFDEYPMFNLDKEEILIVEPTNAGYLTAFRLKINEIDLLNINRRYNFYGDYDLIRSEEYEPKEVFEKFINMIKNSDLFKDLTLIKKEKEKKIINLFNKNSPKLNMLLNDLLKSMDLKEENDWVEPKFDEKEFEDEYESDILDYIISNEANIIYKLARIIWIQKNSWF